MIRALIAALLLSLPAWAGSLSMNGTSDKAVTATPVITAYPYTYFIRFKPTNVAVNYTLMTSSVSTTGLNQYAFVVLNTSGFLRHRATDGATNTSVDTLNVVALGAWNSGLAVGASATSRRVMLNGDIANAATSSVSRTATGINRFAWGVNEDSSPDGFFLGNLGGGAVWIEALTDNDGNALGKGWSPWRINRRYLASYIPYPAAGAAAKDWISGNNLTLTGTTDSTDGPAARP